MFRLHHRFQALVVLAGLLTGAIPASSAPQVRTAAEDAPVERARVMISSDVGGYIDRARMIQLAAILLSGQHLVGYRCTIALEVTLGSLMVAVARSNVLDSGLRSL